MTIASSFADIVRYLKEKYESLEVDEENQRVTITFQGDNTVFRGFVSWDEDAKVARFQVGTLVAVPEPKREAACVLANLVNWKLPLGNFAMDMDDGWLETCLAFYVSDGILGHEQINNNLGFALKIADEYYPAFQKLIWGDLSPEEAIATVKD